MGRQAGLEVEDGHNNTLIGMNAGSTTVLGGYLTAIGDSAMSGGAVTAAADGSVAVGASALNALTSGAGNTAVGFESLKTSSTGTYCTAVGYEAGELITGSLNTVIGYQAADLLASGTSNTVIGARAMGAADGGEQNNVIIGTDAGDVINDDAADGNVIIGQDADPSGSAGTNQIVIGQGATGQSDNSVTLGNADVTNIYMGQDKGAAVRADNSKIYVQGVEFPDTQSASGDDNVLDDYEEGTFTPAIWYQNSDDLTNSTNVTQTGVYTKIGNMCHFQIYLKWNADDARAGDNIGLTGMPFTTKNTTNLRVVHPAITEGTSLGADDTIVGVQAVNTTRIAFQGVGGGDEESNMGDDFGENDNMIISIAGTYTTA